MLNLTSLCILLSCVGTLTALVYNVPSSTMQNVTIGGNIAEVSRSFSLQDVPSGFHTIIVNHLPDGNTVDEKSVQVTGLGAAEVVSTTTQNQVIHRDNDKEYSELSAQLEALSKSLAGSVHSLNLEHARLLKRVASLDTYMSDILRTNSNKVTPLSLEQLTETLDYQEKVLGQHNDKVAALDRKIDATQACLTTVQNILDTLRVMGHYRNTLSSIPSILSEFEQAIKALPVTERVWPLTTQAKELHINVHVPSTSANKGVEKSLVFTIEYMTSPAAWQAEYDIRLELPTTPSTASNTASSSPVEYEMRVALYATVAQSTREDWMDVQLHLSTSQPETHIFAPAPPSRHSLTYVPDLPPQPVYAERMYASSGRAMHKHARARSHMDGELLSFNPESDSGGHIAGGSSLSVSSPVMEMADMTVAEVSVTGQAGTLGSAVVFSPPHAVNITSNHINQRTPNHVHMANNVQRTPLPVNSIATRSTRLFIKEVVVKPRVFTYAVPTTGASNAHLKAWTAQGQDNTAKDAATMPLLESPHGRVFIDSTYTGTTAVPSTQPGSPLRLDLGADRNIQLSSTFVLPRQGSQSEDKVGWFVTDKVKYKVEVVEYAFTVRSTYNTPHLVVLSEYLPHVGEEGIKVELLQPAMETTIQLGDKGGAQQDVWSEQDFLAAVLAHPTLAKPDTGDKMHIFLSKGSNNIVYAKWVQPNQTVQTGLKYRIVWPDGKNINKQVHY